ncbi:MAG: hypothetical protein V2A78_07430 [bacterium]
MKIRFSLLLLTGLIVLLLFSSGCGGKVIETGFDKPAGGSLASASDSADTVTKGSNAILRALTIMDGLILNPVIFFDNIIQQSPPNYNLYEQQTVQFGETPVHFSYSANIRDSIEPDGYILVTAQSPPLPSPAPASSGSNEIPAATAGEIPAAAASDEIPEAAASDPIYITTSYKMRYHTTDQEAPERLTPDGYIRDFTVNSPPEADLVEEMILHVDKLQIKQDGENPFLIDPTDNANVAVRLLKQDTPLEFTIDLSSQKVSSDSGFYASNSVGILTFFLNGQFVFNPGASNTGYPTGTADGSVITRAEDIRWLFYITSTAQNRYYFKLTNETLGFFEGTLILTK